ncbi:MAG: TolC family protein [Fusobacteriota bacterium]
MRKKLTIILSLVIIIATYSETITLDEAIGKAYENNFEVKNSELDAENVELQKKQAYKTVLPKVDYSGSFAKLKDKMQKENPSGSGMIEIEDSDSMYNHSIKVSQPVYNGGTMWTAIKIAKISEDMSDYNLENKKDEIKLSVMESYIGILKLKKEVGVLKSSLEEIDRNHIKLEEFYDLGMVTKTPVLDIEYRKIELESNIMALENNIKIAKSSLKNSLGIKDSEPIELVDLELEDMKYDSELNGDVKYAMDNNLNLKLLDINMKIKKEQEKITRANLLPKINLQFEYKNPETEMFTLEDSIKINDWTWQAGISFNINLWDWGKNLDKLSETKNKTEKFKNEKKNNEENIKLGIRSKYYELERLEKLLNSKEKAYDSAKENYLIEKEKLDENISTATDFLEAENRLRKTEIEIIKTKLDYKLAQEDYKIMVGRK